MKSVNPYMKFLLAVTIVMAAFTINTGCSGKHTKETSSNNNIKGANDASIKNDSSTGKAETAAPVKNEIVYLSDATFDETINKGIVLVDFWASWCGPCKLQAPILEKVNTEMAGKVTIAKLDIDKNRTVTDRYGVMNIPTLIIFNKGKQVKQFVGLTQKEEIMNALNKELN